MRLATYIERGETQPGAPAPASQHVGLIVDGDVVDIAAAARALDLGDLPGDMLAFIAEGDRALASAREVARRFPELLAATSDLQPPPPPAIRPLASVRLIAPIPAPRRNVVCVGLNYAEHVAESQSVAGAALPEYPVFFSKPPSCVIGPDDVIPWHPHVSTAIDWEVELAVVIGRGGRDITEEQALEHVFGYTVANDVTARDLQARHGQWYKGKGLDGFCPLGPLIVTADEIPDPQRLDLCLRVNGIEKQRSNTRFHIFPVARLIAAWSAGMTLTPGDVLLTGTPSGTGIGRTPPEFLRPGDVVEAEVSGIGVLRNVAGGAAA
ncbi:MAG: fumarylacetoacetate hydrolase family protein [Dehalococcoidia bacterium]|nr:fumarylacetoacetate hydrolase family protein [Dehalococcoidia bacterium]